MTYSTHNLYNVLRNREGFEVIFDSKAEDSAHRFLNKNCETLRS